jgi:hypothetical protein
MHGLGRQERLLTGIMIESLLAMIALLFCIKDE